MFPCQMSNTKILQRKNIILMLCKLIEDTEDTGRNYYGVIKKKCISCII